MSVRELNRALLGRQLLLERAEFEAEAEALLARAEPEAERREVRLG